MADTQHSGATGAVGDGPLPSDGVVASDVLPVASPQRARVLIEQVRDSANGLAADRSSPIAICDLSGSTKLILPDPSKLRPKLPSRRSNTKKMNGLDYNYIEGMPAAWPVSSAEGMQFSSAQPQDSLQTGALQNGAWEDFMQWNPNSQMHANRNGVNEHQDMPADPQKSALYSRRAGSGLNESSLSLASSGSAQMAAMASSGIPFTFGQPTTSGPPFSFGSDALISPALSQGQQAVYSDSSAWGSRSPLDPTGSALVSPMNLDRQGQNGYMQSQALSTSSIQHSPDSANITTSPSTCESPSDNGAHLNGKKRKSESSDYEGGSSSKPAPIKKTAHNMIEKRYRTNLNDKIAALRDSVPSLRVMSRTSANGEEEDDDEDLGGLTPAHKLNKATVLSKATEYIRHLEKRNKKLQDEVTALKGRLDSYEKMSMGSMMAVSTPDSLPRYSEDPFSRTSPGAGSSQAPPQGMIPVPENIMALHRGALNQPHYAPTNPPYPGYGPVSSRAGMAGQQPMVNGRGSNMMNKLMVGSLAGLMLMEGFAEREQSGEQPEGRGLFALPIGLLGQLARFLIPRTVVFGLTSVEVLSTLKLFMIIAAFGYLISPLLDFKPRPKKKVAAAELTPAPSLASPVEVRRKAWLTAIQTVWVPQHNFLLEVAALTLKTFKLSTRKLIGWHGYSILTGITKDQEDARVKAWEIALDAQLTGGDAEISMSRLVLTLMASGTLPDTPARLMLKALHIRVLLWEVAKAGYGTWYMFEEISSKIARRYWNAARTEHKLLVNGTGKVIEPLPEHLAALLELDSDAVLTANVVQRAYNLAWNRPSTENTNTDDGMDSVVEDFAISSPLDALAAWWSNAMLKHILVEGLYADRPIVAASLDFVVRTAPPRSGAHIRVLAAKAILVKEGRMEHVDAALKALPSPHELTTQSATQAPSPRTFLNTIGQAPVSADVRTAITLAKCLALAEISPDDPLSGVAYRRAIDFLNTYYRPSAKSFSLLSFVGAYSILDIFCSQDLLLQPTRLTLERMSNNMRIWVGRDEGRAAICFSKARAKCVERCISASKMLVGVVDVDQDESDAGYASQEEDLLINSARLST
jgi:hypothetical protein